MVSDKEKAPAIKREARKKGDKGFIINNGWNDCRVCSVVKNENGEGVIGVSKIGGFI
jgi:hypothetical protein